MISFRKATPDDLPLLLEWQQAPHMRAALPDLDWDFAADLQHDPDWRWQLIAEADNTPIGFVQIIEAHAEETGYWGDVPAGTYAIDIWIGEPAFIGKGYGRAMMGAALSHCFNRQDCHQVLIDPLAANSRAIRFYEKIGFRFLERRMFDDDDCAVYRMRRQDWANRA